MMLTERGRAVHNIFVLLIQRIQKILFYAHLVILGDHERHYHV